MAYVFLFFFVSVSALPLSKFLIRLFLSHLTKRTDVMMAAELYQKTQAGYEAYLGKGESMSL